MAGDNKWLDDQPDGRGGYSGPVLKATMFVPYGVGICWQDASGTWWQQKLVDPGDGSQPYLDTQKVNL